MSKKLDQYMQDCISKKILDIYNFFTKEQLQTLNKLDIIVVNKKYTINDYDTMQEKLLKFYNSKELLQTKGVTPEECHKLIDIFYKIADKYEI